MEEEKVEVLEEEPPVKEQPEKIEIVEHVESKYDGVQPRTEMAELTKEEKKEILAASNEEVKKPEGSNMNDQPVKKKGPSTINLLVMISIGIIVLTVGFFWVMWPKIKASVNNQWDKPIIYIYPEEDMDVEVTVSNPEKFTVTYPKYEDGWKVKALTDGTLIDSNNKKYYALYWEGNGDKDSINKDGFVVKGEDSASFLEEKLEILGLNYKEKNEFIMYWLPKLESNKYNYIRFKTREEIDNNMKLNINPEPDTLIRVMMEYKGLDKKIKVKEEKLTKVERKGYTVVEWGGTEIK